MPRETISFFSTRSATIVYAISVILTGVTYILFASQVTPLLPGFLPKVNLWADLIGLGLIAGGIVIIRDKPSNARLGCYLLVILLFCLAVAIDLRGIFNLKDELLSVYLQSFLKDIGLIAAGLIIANFERIDTSRKGRHRIKSSSESSSSKSAK